MADKVGPQAISQCQVVLGLIPGLVALRTRRISVLAASAAATVWLSLPYLVAGCVLSSGRLGAFG